MARAQLFRLQRADLMSYKDFIAVLCNENIDNATSSGKNSI